MWKKRGEHEPKDRATEKENVSKHTHKYLIKIHTTQRWWCLVVVVVAVAGGGGRGSD